MYTHLELLQQNIPIKIIDPIQCELLVEVNTLRDGELERVDAQTLGLEMPGEVRLRDHGRGEPADRRLVRNIELRRLVDCRALVRRGQRRQLHHSQVDLFVVGHDPGHLLDSRPDLAAVIPF